MNDNVESTEISVVIFLCLFSHEKPTETIRRKKTSNIFLMFLLLLVFLLRQIEMTLDLRFFSFVESSEERENNHPLIFIENKMKTKPRNGNNSWIGDTFQFIFPNFFTATDGIPR